MRSISVSPNAGAGARRINPPQVAPRERLAELEAILERWVARRQAEHQRHERLRALLREASR